MGTDNVFHILSMNKECGAIIFYKVVGIFHFLIRFVSVEKRAGETIFDARRRYAFSHPSNMNC